MHSVPANEALAQLDSGAQGLSSAQAAERLRRHGPNALPEAKRRHPLARFAAQFHNVLIYFLLASALGAAILGHAIDAGAIVAVVLVNAFVGFIQEGKAEKALAAMQRMIAPQASVLRDGARASVPAASLVPGDVVLIEPGDRVPADLRLLRARALRIDEAILTGESIPAAKNETPAPAAADLGARHSMAYSGTFVAAGQGSGVVTATGPATEIGRISALLASVEPLTTPLIRQMNRFAHRFTWVAIAGSAALFAFAVLVRDFPWMQALLGVVALAVSVVPEGLPAVITITLAIGVRRMAARNAVIRRLPAVETLGATSVICSDKTGTLTRNEMTVRRVVTVEHEAAVSGSGYAPEGQIEAVGHDDDAACVASALPLIRCGLLCNDARLRLRDGTWAVEGDPMEGALIALAMKAGLNPEHVRAEWPRLDEVPFDAAYRFMATLHRGPDGELLLFVKGAPEELLARCGMPDDATWLARIARAASAGERVLGFAVKQCESSSRLDVPSIRELRFLGIAGFIDPPRPEALAAIAQCKSAGIAVKMITGDHARTAAAIAAQLGLPAEAVYARATPEDKLRLVRALQAEGAIVAMTGDGVNDAPALKQADVGVAMGIKGTEAAKEAAEMVLADDNFASIVAAVHEGRVVHDNIRKVVAWTLPTNGGEALTVIAALVFGLVLPMTAAQILWVNLVAESALGLALAFEPAEPGVMRRPPRRRDEPLLSSFLLWRVVVVSLLFAAVSLGMFFAALGLGRDLETARTIVVNALVVLQVFYLFNVRYLHMPSLTLRGALGTPAVLWALVAIVAAQLLLTYAPIMQHWFATRSLSLVDGAVVIACGAAFMFLLEAEKLVLRRFGFLEKPPSGTPVPGPSRAG
ncbi:MAG TPA: HAD-IC family P-type ATPase [Burkholderiales bacterium]|nr:HAD-IC family P-type ATPase [Burkholderiales bacterium]